MARRVAGYCGGVITEKSAVCCEYLRSSHQRKWKALQGLGRGAGPAGRASPQAPSSGSPVCAQPPPLISLAPDRNPKESVPVVRMSTLGLSARKARVHQGCLNWSPGERLQSLVPHH